MRRATEVQGNPVVTPPSFAGLDASERAYLEYRRRQALELLSLIPDGAIRPLYRRARELTGSRGEVVDPLGLLLDYCEHLLPLPPFEIWLADRTAHPAAHLDQTGPGRVHRGPAEAVTVETRVFQAGGREWRASLDVRADGDVWRGHITFHAADGARPHETGEIFRESEAAEVRNRFLDFDRRTLEAFLRSVLP